MDNSARPWDWTPPAFFNALTSTILRTPVLHRLMSSHFLLLTFTGHKSGKRYHVPVGYVREGKTVTILTKRFRMWWRNFQEAARVEAWIEGKTYPGTAKALTNELSMIPIMSRAMTKDTSTAKFYGVRLIAGRQPDPEDIRCLAPKLVVLQIALTE
jgi:hypothetical protein